jgi:hypothetical protein
MKREAILGVAALCCAASLMAQSLANLKFADVKALGAVQVSKQELDALLPGAKVENLTPAGSTRYWKNEMSGKFVASTNLVGSRRGTWGAGGGKNTTAQGTWHIGAEGTYCVNLEWEHRTEQWCRYLFTHGDKYYGVKSLENPAGEVQEFSFSR